MNGYIGFYLGQRVEVYADSLYGAKIKVIKKLNVPKNKESLVAVELAERGGKPVEHKPLF